MGDVTTSKMLAIWLKRLFDRQEEAPVLLGWKQNGKRLDIQHGGPVRVVVPGQ